MPTQNNHSGAAPNAALVERAAAHIGGYSHLPIMIACFA
jgi:hypothetical protein